MKNIIIIIVLLHLGLSFSEAVEIDKTFFQKYRISENIDEYLILQELDHPTLDGYAFGSDIENLISFVLPTDPVVGAISNFNFSISKTGTLYISYIDTLYKYLGNSWDKTAFQFDHDSPRIDIIGYDNDNDPVICFKDRYKIVSEGTGIPMTVDEYIAALKPSGLKYYPDNHMGVIQEDDEFLRYPRFIYDDKVVYEATVNDVKPMILGKVGNIFEKNIFFLDSDGNGSGIRTAFFNENIDVTIPSIRHYILSGNKLYLSHKTTFFGVPTPDGKEVQFSSIEPIMTVLDLNTLKETVVSNWSNFPDFSKKLFDQMFLVNYNVYGTRWNQIYRIDEDGVTPITVDIDLVDKYYIFKDEVEPTAQELEDELADLAGGYTNGFFQVGKDILIGSSRGMFLLDSKALRSSTNVNEDLPHSNFSGYTHNGILYFEQTTTSKVEIYDATGKILKIVPKGVKSTNISNLSPGVLIVSITENLKSETFKIINRSK